MNGIIRTGLIIVDFNKKIFRHWLKHENIENFYIYCEQGLCARLSEHDAFVLSMKYPDITEAIKDF